MPQAEAGGIGPAGSQFQHKLPSLDLIHRARDGFTLNAGRMIDFPPKQRILHLCWPFGHNLHLAAVCCLWSVRPPPGLVWSHGRRRARILSASDVKLRLVSFPQSHAVLPCDYGSVTRDGVTSTAIPANAPVTSLEL
jgi:hypothetical protein